MFEVLPPSNVPHYLWECSIRNRNLSNLFKSNKYLIDLIRFVRFLGEADCMRLLSPYREFTSCVDKFLTTYRSAPFGAEIFQIYSNLSNMFEMGLIAKSNKTGIIDKVKLS